MHKNILFAVLTTLKRRSVISAQTRNWQRLVAFHKFCISSHWRKIASDQPSPISTETKYAFRYKESRCGQLSVNTNQLPVKTTLMRKKKSYVHHINYNWTPAPLQPVPLQLVKKKTVKTKWKTREKKTFFKRFEYYQWAFTADKRLLFIRLCEK